MPRLFVVDRHSRLTTKSATLGRELLQVVIDVDLKELPPLRWCHFSEHGVWPPIRGRSCMPRSIEDFEQLLLFEVEVKLCVVGNLEAFWQSQPHRLPRKPVNQNPSEHCPRYEIALIWKCVEAKRTATRQIEVMQHLADVHRSPPARVRRSNPENRVPKLVALCFCEERQAVYWIVVAVGTAVTRRPPHRPVLARLTHKMWASTFHAICDRQSYVAPNVQPRRNQWRESCGRPIRTR